MSKDTDEKANNRMNLLAEDIAAVKRQIKDIDNKIDLILEILNNFTLMVLSDEEDDESLNDEWVPEQNENWNPYEDEDFDG